MLQVQVAYWANQEGARHNRVTEDLGYKTLDETVRHNVSTENETVRHNTMQEQYWTASLQENFRHNQAVENISMSELGLKQQELPIKQEQADAARLNALANQSSAAAGWVIGQGNLAINQQNADTAYQKMLNDFLGYGTGSRNASTASTSADISQQEADIHEEQLGVNKKRAQVQNFTDVMDSVGNAIRNMTDFAAQGFRLLGQH